VQPTSLENLLCNSCSGLEVPRCFFYKIVQWKFVKALLILVCSDKWCINGSTLDNGSLEKATASF